MRIRLPESEKLKQKMLAEGKEVGGFLKEFREFVTRGNVIDLAVGIIIGAAFTGVVDSLVKDIIMPPIGFITGRVDFSSLFIALNGQVYESLAVATEAGAPVLRYGLFINTLINFLIVGFAVFLLVRQVNKLQRREEKKQQEEVPEKHFCAYCFKEVHEKATRCPHCTSELQPAS